MPMPHTICGATKLNKLGGQQTNDSSTQLKLLACKQKSRASLVWIWQAVARESICNFPQHNPEKK